LIEKTTSNGTTEYRYDSFGELTNVTTDEHNITYIYNPMKQRIAKKVDGEIAEKYLWLDLTTLLAVYDKNDNLVQGFEYANGRMPVAMVDKNGTKYYLHYDQVGSLRAVSNQNGDVVKEIVYDTFGNILDDSNPSFKVPFRFAGGLYDRDTKLIHFGFREYDPFTGRWTAKDPILFAGGDTNLYGYVLGDPVSGVDESGLFFFRIVTFIGKFLIRGVKRIIAGKITEAEAGAIGGGIVGFFSTFVDPCGEDSFGLKHFQGYSSLVLNVLSGASLGVIGAVPGKTRIMGLIVGFGSAILSAITGYFSTPKCERNKKCK
jgi:RHS repeat-associated protein